MRCDENDAPLVRTPSEVFGSCLRVHVYLGAVALERDLSAGDSSVTLWANIQLCT